MVHNSQCCDCLIDGLLGNGIHGYALRHLRSRSSWLLAAAFKPDVACRIEDAGQRQASDESNKIGKC